MTGGAHPHQDRPQERSHPDMRDKKQITVKMTEQFAKDLNLLFASYRLTDLSHVVRESVGAQADYIRERMTERMARRGMTYEEES